MPDEILDAPVEAVEATPEPDGEAPNLSVERGDTDPEGVKNQVEEALNGTGADSKVEMVPPAINQ